MIVSINQPDARNRAGIQHDRVVAGRRRADDDGYGVLSRGSDTRLEDVREFSWRSPGFFRSRSSWPGFDGDGAHAWIAALRPRHQQRTSPRALPQTVQKSQRTINHAAVGRSLETER
jgi:hypothetical protein